MAASCGKFPSLFSKLDRGYIDMARHYTTRYFFRQVPNALRAEWKFTA